jgi:hypothetical protein
MTLSPCLLLQSGLALGNLTTMDIPDTSFSKLNNSHYRSASAEFSSGLIDA